MSTSLEEIRWNFRKITEHMNRATSLTNYGALAVPIMLAPFHVAFSGRKGLFSVRVNRTNVLLARDAHHKNHYHFLCVSPPVVCARVAAEFISTQSLFPNASFDVVGLTERGAGQFCAAFNAANIGCEADIDPPTVWNRWVPDAPRQSTNLQHIVSLDGTLHRQAITDCLANARVSRHTRDTYTTLRDNWQHVWAYVDGVCLQNTDSTVRAIGAWQKTVDGGVVLMDPLVRAGDTAARTLLRGAVFHKLTRQGTAYAFFKGPALKRTKRVNVPTIRIAAIR